ncbi:MAG: M23 family metallopeptidase [Thermomicrobiales bacterium]|nr:M23 family metallopeptidase [Thermomicrobiales bacterium]
MFTRRQFITAGSFGVPLLISPAWAEATPQATPSGASISTPPTSAEIVPVWKSAQANLEATAKPVLEAFWAADADTIAAVATDDIARLITAANLASALDALTQNQLQFAFAEVGAWFFGQFTGDRIAGTFVQGGAIDWYVLPEEKQTDSVPTGNWKGVIGPGVIDLGIELVFTGDADTLAVALSTPSQFVFSVPMSEVQFVADLPIGERIDLSTKPAGGSISSINFYGEEYVWGNHTVQLESWWDSTGKLASLALTPQPTLPATDEMEPIYARLPFDGAWLVFWGGDTVFRNYHAATPSQRTAADIMIWRDGSTAFGDGSKPEDYWAFGQPYLAPVDGTIVIARDGFEDITPQGPANPADHAAGNHVVIDTGGGFVYLAHCQQGSVLVAEGDVVMAGQQIANIGNSGNTSEPHVHIHAQSVAEFGDPNAVAVPMVFTNLLVDGEPMESAMLQAATIVENNA